MFTKNLSHTFSHKLVILSTRRVRRILNSRFFAALRMTPILLTLFSNPLFAANKIKIVTTTNTFASIAKEITGDKADIYFIASPKRDIHFISPTPKDILKVTKADIFIHAGLDLEAWRIPLLEAAGKREFINGEKTIDVSQGIALLEIPSSLSRIQGDIHAFGNPHYWLDPLNGKIIAQNIAEGLAKLYPEQADFFKTNAQSFNHRLDEKAAGWRQQVLPLKGTSVVTYHNSWPYFARFAGLEIAGFVEPKPGIPPTPKHIASLLEMMKAKKVKAILKESFFESKTPAKLSKETGAVILTLTSSVGETKETSDYFSLFDYNIRQLERISKS